MGRRDGLGVESGLVAGRGLRMLGGSALAINPIFNNPQNPLSNGRPLLSRGADARGGPRIKAQLFGLGVVG